MKMNFNLIFYVGFEFDNALKTCTGCAFITRKKRREEILMKGKSQKMRYEDVIHTRIAVKK